MRPESASKRAAFVTVVLISWTVAATMAGPLPPDLAAIEGRRLPGVVGTDPEDIRVVVWRDGEKRVVRHQVVEFYADGDRLRHAFPDGPDPRVDPEETFDADDRLIVRVSDGGERSATLDDGYTEVTTTTVLSDGPKWFYVRSGGEAHPRVDPLVRYDPATQRIDTPRYRLGFSRKRRAVIEHLAFGAKDTNLLDRSKARLEANLALGLGIRRNEDDTRVRTTGLVKGPLLVIRESEVRGRIVFGLYSAPVRSEFVFSPAGFVLPTTIRLSGTVRSWIRSVRLRVTMDLRPAVSGMTFSSSIDPAVVDRIDGRGAPPTLTEPTGPLDWYLLRRREAGLLGFVDTEPELPVRLYYRDDREALDPPEGAPGQIGHHGFLYEAGTAELPDGELRVRSYGVVLTGDELSRPGAVVRAAHRPADVRVVRKGRRSTSPRTR